MTTLHVLHPVLLRICDLRFLERALSIKFRYNIPETDTKTTEGIFHCPKVHPNEKTRLRFFIHGDRTAFAKVRHFIMKYLPSTCLAGAAAPALPPPSTIDKKENDSAPPPALQAQCRLSSLEPSHLESEPCITPQTKDPVSKICERKASSKSNLNAALGRLALIRADRRPSLPFMMGDDDGVDLGVTMRLPDKSTTKASEALKENLPVQQQPRVPALLSEVVDHILSW